jgi:hypothetical protein
LLLACCLHIDAAGPSGGGSWGSKQDEASDDAEDTRGSEHDDDFGDLRLL